jgi:hypothetical protein
MSGNHDIGYSIDRSLQARLVQRFRNHFGPLNYEVTLGEHVTFVVVCVMGLEQEESHTELWRETDSFLRSYENQQQQQQQQHVSTGSAPGFSTATEKSRAGESIGEASHHRPVRILLNHVPLWREEGRDCGPLRGRSRALKDRRGFSYRNLLAPSVSLRLLQSLSPDFSFSGDDHDQCLVEHPVPLSNDNNNSNSGSSSGGSSGGGSGTSQNEGSNSTQSRGSFSIKNPNVNNNNNNNNNNSDKVEEKPAVRYVPEVSCHHSLKSDRPP